jgi:hypothetical protein
MALSEEIEHSVKSWEATLATRREGRDWYQLTPAEQEVFDIQRERWPRMLAAWELYEDLIDIVDEGHFSEALIVAERKNWPKLRLQVTDVRVFMDIAVARCSLTEKEAHAMFYKMEFWQVRNGLMFDDAKK